jgi:hypothetical protein
MNFYWLCFYSLVPLKSFNDWEDSLSVARGRDPPPPPKKYIPKQLGGCNNKWNTEGADIAKGAWREKASPP